MSGLLKKAGLKPSDVIRKRDKVYKELDLANETDEPRLLELLVEHPGLLERPIVEVGDKAVLARPIDRALDLIN